MGISTVERYEPREPIVLYAALWQGKLANFVGMPDFNSLATRVISVDVRGLLTMELEDGEKHEVWPGRHYIIRGITGNFFLKTKEEFEKTYQRVPGTAREEETEWP